MNQLCALMLLVMSVAAPAATNTVAPARIIDLKIPANVSANGEASRAGVPGVVALKGFIALPEGFDPRRAWPLLLVTAPSGGSAVQSSHAYTNVALAQGWVVAAVDGPKVPLEKDNNVFGWAMCSSLLDQIHLSWPESKSWPVACAGFSGGAKRAALTAAEMVRQRDVVIGVFMGGCNEDWATIGYNFSRPGPRFLDVPMFLSNGTRDPIAGPSFGLKVKQAMEETGFSKIRLETYNDQHRLDTNQLRLALEWFRPKPAVRRVPPATR